MHLTLSLFFSISLFFNFPGSKTQVIQLGAVAMATITDTPTLRPNRPSLKLLNLLRQAVDAIKIPNAKIARLICRLIPNRCPFERDVILFKKKLFRIPPLCQINPFYREFVDLRLRALIYLADVCGDDITEYIR